jgi:hypothetical protein
MCQVIEMPVDEISADAGHLPDLRCSGRAPQLARTPLQRCEHFFFCHGNSPEIKNPASMDGVLMLGGTWAHSDSRFIPKSEAGRRSRACPERLSYAKESNGHLCQIAYLKRVEQKTSIMLITAFFKWVEQAFRPGSARQKKRL